MEGDEIEGRATNLEGMRGNLVENKNEELEERIPCGFSLTHHVYIYKRVRLYNR